MRIADSAALQIPKPACLALLDKSAASRYSCSVDRGGWWRVLRRSYSTAFCACRHPYDSPNNCIRVRVHSRTVTPSPVGDSLADQQWSSCSHTRWRSTRGPPAQVPRRCNSHDYHRPPSMTRRRETSTCMALQPGTVSAWLPDDSREGSKECRVCGGRPRSHSRAARRLRNDCPATVVSCGRHCRGLSLAAAQQGGTWLDELDVSSACPVWVDLVVWCSAESEADQGSEITGRSLTRHARGPL